MILLRRALLFSCLLKCISAVSSAATGDLLTTFNFGVNDMVADPTRSLIYATVPSTNSIAVIDANTLSVVTTIPIGSNPMGLALSADDNTLYVANSGSTANAIGVVDLTTLKALPSISAPSNPYYLAVGNGGRLYASTGNGIMQFDLGTGTYTKLFPSYPNYISNGPLYTTPDRNTLFEASEGISPATLQKYDISTATGTLLQSINTSEGGSAWPIVTPDGSGVIMSNSYTLEKLSTSNLNTVIGTYNVGAYTGPAALTPDGQWLFATNYDSLEMWNANTFVEKTSFSISSYPYKDLEIDNSGRHLFLAVNNQLEVFSTGVNDNSAILTGGSLAINQGNSTDVISTTTSGSAIQVSPANGHASVAFSGVSKTINVNFTIDNETATFDSTKFSLSPKVTISGGTGTDSVVIQGNHVVTFTGIGTYGGGTKINSGVLAFNNGAALGTGAVTLSAGAELRGIGAVTLNNTVNFASGTTNAVLSAAAGGQVTLNNLDASNTNMLTFGSTGNTGTVKLGSGFTLGTNITGVTVAFGTLANGGGLGPLISSSQVTTTVNKGATLALQDISTTIDSLGGSGSVKLGTKAATVLTLNDATFGGVISGAGSVTAANPLTFTGANTYTGITNITAGQSLTLGAGGTTGSIKGNVSSGSGGLLVFDRSNAYSFAGMISGDGGVKQEGAGVLTLTGKSTYTGGTQVIAGVLAFNNANALGAGAVTLSTGTELRGSATVALNDTVNFATGTTGATLSAKAGATDTFNNLDTSNTTGVTFGSAGNTGTVVIGSNVTDPNGTAFTVAYGALKNGGGLGTLTSNAPTVTINTGATLAANDFNLTIGNLQGSGAINLGKVATTALTLGGGNFSGVISGSGKLTLDGAVTLSGASTYKGGTALVGGTTLVKNTKGSATGTGPVTIQTGATLGGGGMVGGAMNLESGGTIAPGIASPGTAGTRLHGKSLLWDSGSTLSFQLGATSADELVLTGALTKGTAGTFTIDITDAGLAAGSYTLMTFASTTFLQSDFTLVLPGTAAGKFAGTLVENKKSLVLNITPTTFQAPAQEIVAPSTTTDSGSNDSSASITMTPTPEPGSALLLAFGGTLLLGYRRQRHFRAK